MINTFLALKAAGDFRRRHMPYVRTLEDFDLVREIGLHQAEGRRTTLNLLYLKNYGSVPTIQRRLNRLKRLGAVTQAKSNHDGRVVHLTLSPAVLRQYIRLGQLMRQAFTGSATTGRGP